MGNSQIKGLLHGRVSPQRVRSVSLTPGSPVWGVLHQDDKPPDYVASNIERAYFCKSQRARENVNATLKGHTQNLTHSETQKRSCKLKESWIRHTFWSWRASQRNRGNWSSPWGHRHGQQSLGETYPTKRTLELPSSILESPL